MFCNLCSNILISSFGNGYKLTFIAVLLFFYCSFGEDSGVVEVLMECLFTISCFGFTMRCLVIGKQFYFVTETNAFQIYTYISTYIVVLEVVNFASLYLHAWL